jgi:hypothetical protein
MFWFSARAMWVVPAISDGTFRFDAAQSFAAMVFPRRRATFLFAFSAVSACWNFDGR